MPFGGNQPCSLQSVLLWKGEIEKPTVLCAVSVIVNVVGEKPTVFCTVSFTVNVVEGDRETNSVLFSQRY